MTCHNCFISPNSVKLILINFALMELGIAVKDSMILSQALPVKYLGNLCTVWQVFFTRVTYIITQQAITSTKDVLKTCFQDLQDINSLWWRQNGCDSVSNHQPHDCLLNRLFRHRSKKTSKLHVTGLCAGNSPGTAEFPAQMASKAENVSIWWRHHVRRCP